MPLLTQDQWLGILWSNDVSSPILITGQFFSNRYLRRPFLKARPSEVLHLPPAISRYQCSLLEHCLCCE